MSVIIADSRRLKEAAQRIAANDADKYGNTNITAVERATERWLQEVLDGIVEEAELYVYQLNAPRFEKILREEMRHASPNQ